MLHIKYFFFIQFSTFSKSVFDIQQRTNLRKARQAIFWNFEFSKKLLDAQDGVGKNRPF